jgi:hypothetical protein
MKDYLRENFPSAGPESLEHVSPSFPLPALDVRAPKNLEPITGQADFRVCLSKDFKLEPTKEEPRLPFGVFQLRTEADLQHVVCISRIGWLSRLAKVGDELLVGALTDIDESVESNIAYAILNSRMIHKAEQSLGMSIERIYESGQAVQVTVQSTAPRSLLWLASVPVTESYPAIPGRSWNGFLRLAQQQEAHAAFARRREDALRLRQRWSVESMKYREDFPTWFPSFAAELVRKSSRWIELPETAPPVPPVLPPPLPDLPPAPPAGRGGLVQRLLGR